MIVYEEKNYKVEHVTYNCHPETCSHWDHPPFIILKDGNWFKDEDSLTSAKDSIKGVLNLVPMTEEQREQVKQKRIEAQEYAKANLKTDYADEKFWKDKGSELGIRFPGWWIKGGEVKYIRRACKKLGVEVSDYVESTGFKNLNEFSARNPKLNAVCMVGLVIEYYLGRDSL